MYVDIWGFVILLVCILAGPVLFVVLLDAVTSLDGDYVVEEFVDAEFVEVDYG